MKQKTMDKLEKLIKQLFETPGFRYDYALHFKKRKNHDLEIAREGIMAIFEFVSEEGDKKIHEIHELLYKLVAEKPPSKNEVRWFMISDFGCRQIFRPRSHVFSIFKDRKEFDNALCNRRDELDQKIKTMQDEHNQIEQVSSELGMQYAREKGYIK